MVIGALEKLTLIDYPGHLAAIIFTQGCNFRCRFCYNPMLVLPAPAGAGENNNTGTKGLIQGLVPEEGLFEFLKSRQGKLEGVVITGGEPTLQPDLPDFIKKIKSQGFLVKLDTNGTNPKMLKNLISEQLVDYVAMDLKSDEKNYQRTVGVEVDWSKIKESVKIIINSGLSHEFRTTCVPGFHTSEIIKNMAQIIKGAEKWYLQNFKSDTDLIEESLRGQKGFSREQMKELAHIGTEVMGSSEVRS